MFGSLDYRTHVLPAVASGQAFAALAARSATLSTVFLPQFTQATAALACDPAAVAVKSTALANGAVRNTYDSSAFAVQFTDGPGRPIR